MFGECSFSEVPKARSRIPIQREGFILPVTRERTILTLNNMYNYRLCISNYGSHHVTIILS
jgi:hypothetical protein